MITCASCGNMINEGDKFCQYCGSLVVQAPVEPEAPAAAHVCVSCGEAIEEDDKFCQYCGTPVAAPVPAVEVVEEAVEETVEEAVEETVEETVEEAVEVEEETPAAAHVCVSCGEAIEEGDKFCQYCGTPVAAPAPAVEIVEETVEEVAEEVAEETAEEVAEEIVEEVTEEAAEEIVEEVAEEEVTVDDFDGIEESVPVVEEAEKETVEEADTETVAVEPMGYDYPYLVRRANRQVIDVNKAFFRIGSEKNVNNYVLDGVGGMHAMIITTAGKYFIVDLGTEGKTFVNGEEIAADTEVELTAGCSVRLANEDFVFII